MKQLSPCADIIRKNDYPRYLATLYAPPHLREHFFALLALEQELGSIHRNLREPLIAEMRFTWWREEVEKLFSGNMRKGQPVLEGLYPLAQAYPKIQSSLLAMIENWNTQTDMIALKATYGRMYKILLWLYGAPEADDFCEELGEAEGRLRQATGKLPMAKYIVLNSDFLERLRALQNTTPLYFTRYLAALQVAAEAAVRKQNLPALKLWWRIFRAN